MLGVHIVAYGKEWVPGMVAGAGMAIQGCPLSLLRLLESSSSEFTAISYMIIILLLFG